MANSATQASRSTQRMVTKPTICLVTPALADANNGNWQTAKRWARMLSADYRVVVLGQWPAEAGQPSASVSRREPGVPLCESCDAMVALHAARSAPSIHAFANAHPDRPLVVALTGTDLYRDIRINPQAEKSLALATRLIVLQDQAPKEVPLQHRHKVDICFQSSPTRRPLSKTATRLRAVVVGHLRDVKDPRTVMRAMRRLAERKDIVLDHIGEPLDASIADDAKALAQSQSNYRWHGGLPHAATLARIQRAHVLVHPSLLEGGAHVVMEAACSGTPVLASRMAGNMGMLGAAYEGYFEVGDDAELASLLLRAREDPAWLTRLTRQVKARASLFAPQREQSTLRAILRHSLR